LNESGQHPFDFDGIGSELFMKSVWKELKVLASSRWYSSSLAEPRAMEQKRASSVSPFLAQPSASFAIGREQAG
jgi:hypothetical protein